MEIPTLEVEGGGKFFRHYKAVCIIINKKGGHMKKIRVLILGAAGRDFHNFNTVFRKNPNYRVVGFTAAQIPDIAGRKYPPVLSGKFYPQGVPIYDEADLEKLIKTKKIDQCFLSFPQRKVILLRMCSRLLRKAYAARQD